MTALFFAGVTMAHTLKDRKDIARLCTAFIIAGVIWGCLGALSLRQLASGAEGGERFSGSNVSAGVFVQTGGLFLPLRALGLAAEMERGVSIRLYDPVRPRWC